MFKKPAILFLLVVLFILFLSCSKKYIDINNNELPKALGYSVEFVEESNCLYDTILMSVSDLSLTGIIDTKITYELIELADVVFIDNQIAKKNIDIWYINLVIKKASEANKTDTYESLVVLYNDLFCMLSFYNKYTDSDLEMPNFMLKDNIDYVFGVTDG